MTADFQKVDKKQHIVSGYAVTTDVDRDGQSMDSSFIQRAFPAWSDRYGNIRHMHQPKVVGHVIHRSDFDGRGYIIDAKISDADTFRQILEHELNGFSVGLKGGKLVPSDVAKNGTFVDGEFLETSVVDIPSNPMADFMTVKAATFDPSTNTWLDDNDDGDAPDGDDDDGSLIDLSWMIDGVGDADIDAYKRYYSPKQRRDMPASDFAGPHRSFPIITSSDITDASRLIGHAKNPDEVKRRIIEIAHRKGLSDAIPESWRDDAQKTLDTSSGLQGYNLEGDEGSSDRSNSGANTRLKEGTQKLADDNNNTPAVADETKAAVDGLRQVMDGMVTALNDIRSQIEAMASQSDPDKDGDIDDTTHPEAEGADGNTPSAPVVTANNDAPNAIQDTLDNGLKTVLSDTDKAALVEEITKSVLAELGKAAGSDAKTLPAGTSVTWHYRSGIGHGTIEGIAEKGDTSAKTKYRIRQHDHHKGEPDVVEHFGSALTVTSDKSALADVVKSVQADTDTTKSLVASVQKSVSDLDAQVKKFVERLEVVEQSAAPAKGVTMVVDKFANADNGANGADREARVAEIMKTVRANNHGLSPVLLQQRIDAAIAAEFEGGQK